jgi:FkbM family methyltransferase
MEYIIHPSSKYPIGVRIDGIDGSNDGDLAIFHLVISQMKTIPPNPNSICVDIGADRGWFSRLMLAVCPENTSVFAFEPNPASYKDLVAGLKRDNKNRVYAFPIAISSEEATLKFVFDGPCSHSRGADGQDVYAKPLDAVIEAGREIYWMKIDTEGHDLDVLKSARGHITRGGVKHIVFEYTAFWLGSLVEATDKTRVAFEDLLDNYKYMYALSRCGPTYLVGPIQKTDIASFVDDHYTRHLQTDIYVTNSEPVGLPVFPFECGKYFA